jgi:hypothetical protein
VKILRVPKFKNIEEEAEFWDSTDTSEILRTGECVKVEWDSPGKCPLCQTENLRYRFVDIDLCEGAVTLHGVEVHYCPLCKKIIVPETTKTQIEEIIKRLQHLKAEEISAIVNAV